MLAELEALQQRVTENDQTLLQLVMGLAAELTALRAEVAGYRAYMQMERPVSGSLYPDLLRWPVMEITAPGPDR